MISDEEILAKCQMPSQIPIDTDMAGYRSRIVSGVRREMSRGSDLDSSIRRVTGYAPVSKRRTGTSRAGVLAMGVALLLGASGAAWAQHLEPNTVDALTPDNQIQVEPMTDDETILVVGTDDRPEKDAGSGSSADVPGSRTDMIAMLTIPKDGSHAVLVSFPRDLAVTRPVCKKFDPPSKEYSSDTESSEAGVKINSVYQVGGPQCLTKTVESTTGTKIKKYVQTNFEAFQSLVDSVGGVDVDVPEPIVDDTLGTIVDKPGKVTLDGAKALSYVRARKVEGTGKSDFDRIIRQQKFLDALADKARTKITGGDVAALVSMARDVVPKLTVDDMDLSSAISLANTLGKMPRTAITSTTFPVSGEDDQGNLTPDKVKASRLFSAIRLGTPMVDTPVAASKKSDAIKSKVKQVTDTPVTIVAKSEDDEDAARIKSELSQVGITASVVSNKGAAPEKSTISFPRSLADDGVTLASWYSKSQVQPDQGKSVRFILGDDAGYMNASRTTSHGVVYVPLSGGQASSFVPLDIKWL